MTPRLMTQRTIPPRLTKPVSCRDSARGRCPPDGGDKDGLAAGWRLTAKRLNIATLGVIMELSKSAHIIRWTDDVTI